MDDKEIGLPMAEVVNLGQASSGRLVLLPQ